jgi:hypothetical protein
MSDNAFRSESLQLTAQTMLNNPQLLQTAIRAPSARLRVPLRTSPATGASRSPTAVVPPPAAVPTPVAPPLVPTAPADNPFDSLPYPAAGDRIKADDFKKLSQALDIIADMTALSGSLFGRSFGEVKQALASQGYAIARVMSVFGAEIADLNDASLDGRKVIQVVPVALGVPQLMVVVTEAVDTRRFMPNLIGLTYAEAQERIRSLVGDVPLGGPPPSAPSLVGLTLNDVQRTLGS